MCKILKKKKGAGAFPDSECILVSIHLSAEPRHLQVINMFWIVNSWASLLPLTTTKPVCVLISCKNQVRQ